MNPLMFTCYCVASFVGPFLIASAVVVKVLTRRAARHGR